MRIAKAYGLFSNSIHFNQSTWNEAKAYLDSTAKLWRIKQQKHLKDSGDGPQNIISQTSGENAET